MPHTFLLFTTMSFGHFIRASSPVTLVMAFATASAATSVSMDALFGLISGFIISVMKIPVPDGDTQLRPRRPLPDSCLSATTKVPLG